MHVCGATQTRVPLSTYVALVRRSEKRQLSEESLTKPRPRTTTGVSAPSSARLGVTECITGGAT